jgi:hypothetical protein
MLLHRHSEPEGLVLTLDGAVAAGEVAQLRGDAARLITAEPEGVVVVDLALTRSAEVAVVEAVVHLLLVARRNRRSFRVRHASDAMRTLLEFAGLSDVLRVDAPCRCRTCGAHAAGR